MLSSKFVHLREHCRTHSIAETNELFKESFDQDIKSVFKFNEEPIASGSIGQVYKAQKDCEDYVIKVRHPGVKEMIDKDLSIIFGALEMVSYLPGTGITEFPATVHEFKKVLYE
jgi:predicted unusual protein kinase regulating ubiquinone biosynthesis (AarF/ABC1/UbiB family)